MFSILVVEDDESLNKLMMAKLKQEQFKVQSAFDGEEALAIMDHTHIDLVICDIMMPKMDGYALTEAIRSAYERLPILMVTAKNQIEDMEKGFKLGTDDYLIKPFNMKELVLRVYALLKRAQIAYEKKLHVGQVVLDYEGLSLTIGEEHYDLPPKEFYLLFKLLSNPDRIYTRIDLIEEIWGIDTEVDERTVDAHIKKLRRKFEHYSDFDLITVRGLGYKGHINTNH